MSKDQYISIFDENNEKDNKTGSFYKVGSVTEIYKQLEHYVVIGLTGRCGSGCSTTRDILCSDNKFAPKEYLGSEHVENLINEDRDQEIILSFSKDNNILGHTETKKIHEILA